MRKEIHILIAFITLAFPSLMRAQLGCTDWQALNYDESAMENDGSCFYPETSYTLNMVQNLPAELNENSGLLWHNDSLWLHNDGGNPAEWYTMGPPTNEFVVRSLDWGNSDWEDFADDSSHVYILDTGNNSTGVRTDLSVARVNKSSLSNDALEIESSYQFAYADQVDFETVAVDSTHYDCEAGVMLNGKLHLFTKDWIDQSTRCYVLDPDNPQGQLSAQSEFFVDGLITAADIADDGTIVLLGYDPINVFVWLLWDYPPEDVFGGNKRRIGLGISPTLGQTEGVVFTSIQSGFISAERIAIGPFDLQPLLWSFDFSEFTSIPEQASTTPEFLVKGSIISWDERDPSNLVEVYTAIGQLVEQEKAANGALNLSHLSSGAYVAILRDKNRIILKSKIVFSN